MPSFKDALGQTWSVELTGGTVRRARDRLGIDLGKPRAGDSPWLVRFEEDIAFKVDLLYVILLPQIREGGWTDEEFAELLADEALRDASVAVYGALTDFFLHLGRQEDALATQSQLALLPDVYGSAARRAQSLLIGLLGSRCASWQRSPAAGPTTTHCASSS